jgi:competence protein ComEC
MLPLSAIAFLSGVCLLQGQEELPSLSGMLLLLPPAFAAWRLKGKRRTAALLLFVFGFGFYWAACRAEWRLAQTLPPELEWRDIIVEGTVRGLPQTNEQRTRFDFDIERIVSPTMPLRLRVRLADYHRSGTPLAEIFNNAQLRLVVRIRPPSARLNPHGFDYAGYLFATGVRAVGYVRHREQVEIVRPGGGWREALRRQALAQPQQGDLLAAFVVGDRSAIDESQWRVLQRTGTAHLLSISGTHITLAAGFAALLVGWLWRRQQWLMRIMPAQKAAIVAAVPVALAYALLAGFGVPVRRSFLMFFAVAVALLSGGISSASQVMALAALVVVVVDPWAVSSAGFWLSFMLAGAVVLVLGSTGGRNWWHLLRVQCLISFFAMPFTLWFFNQASLLSPLANVVAVPVVGFFILPLVLLDVLLPGNALWTVASWGLSTLWAFLDYLSALPFAAWQPAAAPWWLFILACAGGIWLIMPAGMPARWTGMFPVLAMLLWQPSPLPVGTFHMTVLDIGQGTSVVIKTTNHTLVYDAGRSYAAKEIDSYLRGEGRRNLDMLIVSHDDIDHSGGAAELMHLKSPVKLLSSLPDSHPAVIAATHHQPCEAGQMWTWDGVTFEILHPQRETLTVLSDIR